MLHLETTRLVLKPHTLSNVDKLNAWENDPDLLYYNDDQHEPRKPDSLEDTRRTLKRISERAGPDGRTIYYAIHTKHDGEPIGYGMIAFIDRYHRRCQIGITIGEKQLWGQGFAREALQAIVEYCFTTLDMNRIGAGVYTFNERSIRLFEDLGFKREGAIREHVFKNGQFADEIQYGILRREWEALPRG